MHIPFDNSSSGLEPIRLVQLTDSHLGDQPGEQLLGLDTDESLELVTQLALKERGRSDVLLATGDIANHGAEPAYRRFYDKTQNLANHALWLPGNHDNWLAMQNVLVDDQALARSANIANWQIVMLNSTIPGQVGGAFSKDELAFLNETLKASNADHILLCLHHHPIDIACDWLDPQQVTNSDDFFTIVDSSPKVRGVLWGHIHQQIDQLRKGVKLMSTPSTCIQFAANSREFELARLNPGYRWLELYTDGRIDTEVSRLQGVDFSIDYDSAGY